MQTSIYGTFNPQHRNFFYDKKMVSIPAFCRLLLLSWMLIRVPMKACINQKAPAVEDTQASP